MDHLQGLGLLSPLPMAMTVFSHLVPWWCLPWSSYIYISFANLAGVPGRTMWHVCHLQAGILAARRSTVKNATVFRVLLQYVLTLS
jgi:hypothetical protein